MAGVRVSEPSIVEELDAAQKKERAQRKRTMITVAIPGWPPQDPGRLMIWETRSSPMKAAREIKKLQEKMPEYIWSKELLTYTEARKVKLKPFSARALYRRNQTVAPGS